jgi:molybdenum cofactor cytidylyltransferase
MTENLTTIVLAAGLSRRMGNENKLLLPFGASSILETTLSRILEAEIGEIFVVIGHEAEDVIKVLQSPEIFQSKKGPLSINAKNTPFFTILTNNHYEKGMTTSIQTGVAAAGQGSCGFMICLSDMPHITPADYTFLAAEFLKIQAIDKQAILQPTFAGKRGNPTIFSSFYRNDLLNLTFSEGCKPIVAANADHVYLLEMPTDAVLRDIDTKADYLEDCSK